MTTIAKDKETTGPPRAADPEAWVTSAQWALTFVPFGLGLVAAIWLAELTQDLRLFRTIYTVRVALLLAIPALALFPFRDHSPALRNLWRLFWTFSFLAYLVHLWYAWFEVFGGQLETARLHPESFHVTQSATILDLVIAQQGAVITYSNLAVTAFWLLDVLLAWVSGRGRGAPRGPVVLFHGLTWLFVLVSFLVSSVVFFKNNTTYTMGWVLAGAVALALLIRLFSKRPVREAST